MLFTYKKNQAKCNISCTFVLGFTNIPPYICTLFVQYRDQPNCHLCTMQSSRIQKHFFIKNVVLRC